MIGNAYRPKSSREELLHLISIYQTQKSAELQKHLVCRFTPLVESLAKKFARGRIPTEDLVQVGMIGLLAALYRFDAKYGRSFECFAIPTIVGEMKRFIRDKTWCVHVPRRIKELNPKIKRAVDELTVLLQRSPCITEIALHLGVTEEEVLEALEMGRNYQPLSIDSELEADSDGNTFTLLELIGCSEDGFDDVERHLMINRALDVLDQREKAIIHLTYFQNLSQRQAGDMLGMSQMHVSRLQRRALSKMREALCVEPNEAVN